MEEVETESGITDMIVTMITIFFFLLFLVLAMVGIIFSSIFLLNATFA